MTHSYAFDVRLHDVDHAGVMFFARLFVHAHDAYEAFMAHLGLDLCAMIRTGERLPIVHASADYFQPLRHGEQITVTLEIEALGRNFIYRNLFFSRHGGPARQGAHRACLSRPPRQHRRQVAAIPPSIAPALLRRIDSLTISRHRNFQSNTSFLDLNQGVGV